MNEILELARSLSKSDDEALTKTLEVRMLQGNAYADFFDVATALLKPTWISLAVAGLNRQQLVVLQDLIAGKKVALNSSVARSLESQRLVESRDDGFYVYEATRTAFESFKKCLPISVVSPKVAAKTQTGADESIEALEQSQVDAHSAIAAFEVMQAITELVLDLDLRMVREVGRGGVGLPELKRLAAALSKPVDYARAIYEIARLTDLVSLSDKRWRVGGQGASWLASEPAQRFAKLARMFRQRIGDAASETLAESQILSGGQMISAIEAGFPLANEAMVSHIKTMLTMSEQIGLSHAGQAASWMPAVLNRDYSAANSLLSKFLPAAEDRLIIQANLTLIAPAPLRTQTETLLRRFAYVERIGIASTYRVNALSIVQGLETGMSEDQIRQTLQSLSAHPLPQPVDYLIRESSQRFMRLTLQATAKGTVIRSTDPMLLAQIYSDQQLKPLSIAKGAEDRNLHSRFELDVVYFQLRDENYAAVRIDENGDVISPLLPGLLTSRLLEAQSEINLHLQHINRWRDHEAKLGSAPEGDDIVRHIELTIKNKGSISITVKIGDEARDFLLEPIGLANGRLRARDRKADTERVIPLEKITAVRLG